MNKKTNILFILIMINLISTCDIKTMGIAGAGRALAQQRLAQQRHDPAKESKGFTRKTDFKGFFMSLFKK